MDHRLDILSLDEENGSFVIKVHEPDPKPLTDAVTAFIATFGTPAVPPDCIVAGCYIMAKTYPASIANEIAREIWWKFGK